MKWKRSRKAQQESKNKDNHSSSSSNNNNNDEKISRDRSTSSHGQTQSTRNGLNEKLMTNLTNSNFHFPKNIDPHLSQHTIHASSSATHPRHNLTNKEVMPNGGMDESYSSNLISRVQPNVFGNDAEDMIWRVV